jgi:malonate decarboxylase beta subunit
MDFINQQHDLELGKNMEKFTIRIKTQHQACHGTRVVCGVVGSGNLEVIVEPHDSCDVFFRVTTAIEHFKPLWKRVIRDFCNEYSLGGLLFTLNDHGATPAVVALRLRQAFELFQDKRAIPQHYLELNARERINALLTPHSFSEWLTDGYSPYLRKLNIPGQADDGLVIGKGMFDDLPVLIGAQQKDFMGGSVGEIHGAKLTALFNVAKMQRIQVVILLIDSGGVRLHEANAGEIAISEIIRALLNARHAGVTTIGVICGKNGAFGGMGIIASCLDYIIVSEISRIGVSGPEVIQAVKGVEVFDAQDKALIWRVYGGKTRYLQHAADAYISHAMEDVRRTVREVLSQPRRLTVQSLQETHALLKARFDATEGYEEEGSYLKDAYPKCTVDLFDANDCVFLKEAVRIREKRGVDK